jgi:hypothetical protein
MDFFEGRGAKPIFLTKNKNVTAVFEAQEGKQARLGLSHDERDKCLKLRASKAGHRRERRNKDKYWPLFCSLSTLWLLFILT